VRSTPARLLHQDQLVVERFGVHKIREVEHAIPHNTVTIRMTHQMTGNWATRNLRWDERVTTEEALEVKIGDTGKITIELALIAGDRGRPLYRWRLTDEAVGIDHAAKDLQLGARMAPDNKSAAKTLLSDLRRAAGAQETELEGGIDSEALDRFPGAVNDWAYAHAAEIEMAQVELGRGLETGR
jgi:hypothetical protein